MWNLFLCAGQRMELTETQLQPLAVVTDIADRSQTGGGVLLNAHPQEHADRASDVDYVRLEPVVLLAAGHA